MTLTTATAAMVATIALVIVGAIGFFMALFEGLIICQCSASERLCCPLCDALV